MSGVEFVSVADWNAATDRAIKDPRYTVADDPRCLYGWGPSKDRSGPNGCTHRFGHMCSRPFRHPGNCIESNGANDPRLPCEQAPKPKDWDDNVRTECNS